MEPIKIPKEFIREYFLHVYAPNIETGEVEFAPEDNVKRVKITEEHDFFDETTDSYFGIWCNNGHLIKTNLYTIVDLVQNGCPFCKKPKHYDWQRHINYSDELNNLGFIGFNITELSIYGYMFYSIVRHDLINNLKVVYNRHYIDINKLEDDDKVKFGVCRYKRILEDSSEEKFQCPMDIIAEHVKNKTLQSKNVIVLPNVNYEVILDKINPSETDVFYIECENCKRPRLISALSIDHGDYKCPCCGEVLIRQHRWFSYDYTVYDDKADYYTNNIISLYSTEYLDMFNSGTSYKLSILKRSINKYLPEKKKHNERKNVETEDTEEEETENIPPLDKNMSLLEWCQHPKNNEIGQIVINQFAPVKNRKKLSEIPAYSDEVIWLKSQTGSLFDTTVKSIVKKGKIREKLPRGTSYAELFVYYALKNCYSEVIHRYKTPNNIEFDIYIPEINQCIEYNGSVYHKIKYDKSEKDLEKQKYCKDNHMKLLVIEDDNEKEEAEIKDNKIVFKDSYNCRNKQLYEVCEMISIYLFIEKDLPSIEEIKKSIKLFY